MRSILVVSKARIVTVREPNGTLRHASGSERQRILDMYFPTKDRSYKTPTMFDQDNLEVCDAVFCERLLLTT